MFIKKYRPELTTGFVLLLIVIITIVYGSMLTRQGTAVRSWQWQNLLMVLPLLPLLLLQRQAALPPLQTICEKKNGWRHTVGAGTIFGLLDVLVIKIILHPEPYDTLPPFLQPFPYSLFLYTSGALEVELYYRMLPLTLLLLADAWLLKKKLRTAVLILLGVATSLIEPVLQFPDGVWWLVIYATASGVAMNAWQYRSYLKYGFAASLAVRLGHYLVWHILLGLYVQYVELAG